jgi:uncharacterized protein (TIGR02246 family)
MAAARTPEEVDLLFVKALNAGDIDALMELYEPQASLMPSPGKVVAGTAAIREGLGAFLAARPNMTMSQRLVSRTEDLALATSKWEATMTGPDGKRAAMNGQSVEVLRRQADGSWRFAIDMPFGVEAVAPQ